ELDQRGVAAGPLALGDQLFVLGRGQKYEGILVLLVDPPARLLEAELVAVEIERGIEIAHAQHGVQISHGTTLTVRKSFRTRPYMIAADLQTAIARLSDLFATARMIVPFTGAGISTECGIPDFRSPGGIWTKMAPIPFDEFMASQQARDESWRRRFA